jgi:predicted flavoprotein YhiN
LRETIVATGEAIATIDLRPDHGIADLAARLGRLRGGQSMSSHLRKALNLDPTAIGLLREGAGMALPTRPDDLATLIKAVPLRLTGMAPIARAISTAGGIALDELDDRFMLRRLPGIFAAGEMLDWDAPTGGYLLQASFATAVAAAEGIDRYLGS